MLKIKKGYWMTWEDGYGAVISYLTWFDKPLFRKWNSKRVYRKLNCL